MEYFVYRAEISVLPKAQHLHLECSLIHFKLNGNTSGKMPSLFISVVSFKAVIDPIKAPTFLAQPVPRHGAGFAGQGWLLATWFRFCYGIDILNKNCTLGFTMWHGKGFSLVTHKHKMLFFTLGLTLLSKVDINRRSMYSLISNICLDTFSSVVSTLPFSGCTESVTELSEVTIPVMKF